MGTAGKYTFKKILVAIVWMLIATGAVVLLVAAISKRNNERCSKVEINIKGVQNNFFIDKKDVLAILQNVNSGAIEMSPLHTVDLALMENELQKSRWINRAELFFDNNNMLHVNITEREPVARIFSVSGSSYYIDTSLTRLPLSNKFSPRLPVFTSFPGNDSALSHNDSNIIKDIKILSEFIGNNDFWMAEIEQVDISPAGEFDLIPKLGNGVIHFGNAENYQQKFNNLFCFYRQVLAKKGWNCYSAIDAQYKGQIVGVRRNSSEIKADSLRSVQIMKALIAEAQKHANDSTVIEQDQQDDDNINTSKEVETAPDEATLPITKNNKALIPVIPFHVPEKSSVEHAAPEKKSASNIHPSSSEKPKLTHEKPKVLNPLPGKTQETIKQQPKAVMPPKTDY